MSFRMVRRLPVIQSEDSEDAAAARRPRWQWIGIGALIGFTLWLPLLMLALWGRAVLVSRWLGGAGADARPDALADVVGAASSTDRVLLVLSSLVPVLASLGLASAVAGAVVGRFGGVSRAREAAAGGALVAVVAWAIGTAGAPAAGSTVAFGSLLVLAGVGAAGGFAGGILGERRRPTPVASPRR